MIDVLFRYLVNEAMFIDFFNELYVILHDVDWITMFKVGSVMVVAMLLVCALIMINDRIYDNVITSRMKVHHLTIRNDGNFDSLYLLHTVDLPNTLAIRFRIDGNPMIWVTYNSDKKKESGAAAAEPGNEAVGETASVPVPVNTGTADESGASLVPDLKDPLKPVESVTKAVSDVGKKAGFFASIFSTLSVLLPNTPSLVKEAQGALKGIQQDSNTLVGQINTKTSAFNTLGDQLGKLPGADKVGEVAKSAGSEAAEAAKSAIPGGQQNLNAEASVQDDIDAAVNGKLNLSDKFVYDEDIWRNNINKVDENGGALVYAQSKILKPGESMKVDIEIMNMAESPAAMSQLYKIEVVQIPQAKMHLSNASRFLNGIVVFERVSKISRVFPPFVAFMMIIVAIQIVAAYTYLLIK